MDQPIVISLRGTNGAGKSHLVHKLIERATAVTELREHQPDGHRRINPSGFLIQLPETPRKTFIPGHYRIQNGGVDTLPGLIHAYAMMGEHLERDHDVVYEGKNMSDGVSGALLTFTRQQLIVVALTTSLQECIASVRARGHSIKEKTIDRTFNYVAKQITEFRENGVRVETLDRSDAFNFCVDRLKRAVEK